MHGVEKEEKLSFSSSDPALTINQLPTSLELPEDPDVMRQFLIQYLRRVANAVNSKEGGLYSQVEYFSGTQYLTNLNNQGQQNIRNVYRKVFDMVALNGGNIAGSATVSFPHGIANIFQAAPIYANCTSAQASPATQFFTVVYPDVELTSTNVIFTNPLGVALSACYVVANVLKN
jgi:hypothetical protein